jgi:hypothetical protein
MEQFHVLTLIESIRLAHAQYSLHRDVDGRSWLQIANSRPGSITRAKDGTAVVYLGKNGISLTYSSYLD